MSTKESDRELFYKRLDSLYFIDDEHKKNFVSLTKGKELEWNPEYTAAYYLLTVDREIRAVALKYVGSFIDFKSIREDNGFEFLLNEQKIIIDVANNLYNWNVNPDLLSVVCLYHELYQCAQSAFSLRRGQLPMGFLDTKGFHAGIKDS